MLKSKYLSFINKKCLTNGVDGFTHYAMNANEISPKAIHTSVATPRLARIKRMSRFLKVVFLIYFVVIGLVLVAGHIKTPIPLGDQTFASFGDIPAELKIYEAIRGALYLLAVVAFYRLLDLYEKGTIFSAENVSQLRRLGSLAVDYALLKACLPILEEHGITFPSFPINFLFSPWFIVGCLTIIIAWVMDEGRKIQEEQELTV